MSPHQPTEVEVAEVEESEQFSDFAEEVRVYEGYRPEAFSVVFVDGVRRTECIVYVRDEEAGESYEGAFLSLGAGALRVDYGKINLLRESLLFRETRKLLFLRGSDLFEEVFGFKPVRVEGEISSEVNRYMKEELEARVALKVLKSEKGFNLLLCDGTLSHKLKNTPACGFVKSIKRLYFDKTYTTLLNSLKPGQRSPIVKVHYQQTQESEERVDKYTWYVKLSPAEGLHGLARVEVFPQKDLDLRKLADLSAGILPLFASQPFQDRRSPQNLLPIGRLEKFIRLHLGHHSIIRRQIESFLYA